MHVNSLIKTAVGGAIGAGLTALMNKRRTYVDQSENSSIPLICAAILLGQAAMWAPSLAKRCFIKRISPEAGISYQNGLAIMNAHEDFEEVEDVGLRKDQKKESTQEEEKTETLLAANLLATLTRGGLSKEEQLVLAVKRCYNDALDSLEKAFCSIGNGLRDALLALDGG